MDKKRILLSIALSLCIGLTSSACNDTKYKVSQDEYEAAFTAEALSNVTISIEGPYWERDHFKECYYAFDNGFVYARYKEEVPYYGQLYEIKNGEEAYYVYGSESFSSFKEEDAVWSKSWIMIDENSFFHNAEFVALYRRDFHLLEYDKKTKSYEFDFVAQGRNLTYTYFFKDKRLVRFEITQEGSEYNLIWRFYDYGKTNIPEWVLYE